MMMRYKVLLFPTAVGFCQILIFIFIFIFLQRYLHVFEALVNSDDMKVQAIKLVFEFWEHNPQVLKMSSFPYRKRYVFFEQILIYLFQSLP